MRKVTAVLAGIALALTGLVVFVAPSYAAAGGECVKYNPVTSECEVVLDPGPVGGEEPGGGPAPGGEGPSGPAECLYRQIEIPCTKDGAVYVASLNCYVRYAEEQGKAPLDDPSEEGGWYDCINPLCDILSGGTSCSVPIWLPTRPPGVAISPEQAAQAVAARLEINAIEIGMAPRVNPDWGHRRTHVGVPVWLWVANPGPTTFDGYSVSDSEGGLSVTGSVKVSSLEWNMGDGSVVVCGTKGQSYEAGFGWAESPDCGHMYQQTSQSQAGDRYAVTATSRWQFQWEAGGQTGTIDLDTQSSESLEVNEMQTVNVSPNG